MCCGHKPSSSVSLRHNQDIFHCALQSGLWTKVTPDVYQQNKSTHDLHAQKNQCDNVREYLGPGMTVRSDVIMGLCLLTVTGYSP